MHSHSLLIIDDHPVYRDALGERLARDVPRAIPFHLVLVDEQPHHLETPLGQCLLKLTLVGNHALG